MGEGIANGAAFDDIFADSMTTHSRAIARGGKWKQLAEGRLGTGMGAIANVCARLSATENAIPPTKAPLETQDKMRRERLPPRVMWPSTEPVRLLDLRS